MVSIGSFGRVLRSIILLAVVLVLGWGAGSLFGRKQVQGLTAARKEAQAKDVRAGVVGIAIGAPFPPLVVWSPDNLNSHRLRDLVTRNTVVLLASPGCDVCISAAESLRSVLLGDGPYPAKGILLTDKASGTLEFAGLVKERGIKFDVYSDSQELLRGQHKVYANPVYFCLDSASTILDLGVGVPDAARLKQVFNAGKTP